MTLRVKQRITLLRIDDVMALTHRNELEVRQVLPEPYELVGYYKTPRMAVVRQRGKRKDQYFDIKPDYIVLDGWDVPFRADTECSGVMAGNACFNLVGLPAVVRDWLDNKAVFPVSASAKGKVLVSPTPRTSCDDSDVIVLYPDINTHHAVMDRMKARAERPFIVGAPNADASPGGRI